MKQCLKYKLRSIMKYWFKLFIGPCQRIYRHFREAMSYCVILFLKQTYKRNKTCREITERINYAYLADCCVAKKFEIFINTEYLEEKKFFSWNCMHFLLIENRSGISTPARKFPRVCSHRLFNIIYISNLQKGKKREKN